MLQPGYLFRVTEAAEEASSKLHTRLIKKIVERIVARMDRGEEFYLTPTDEWNAMILRDSGKLMEEVAAEVAKYIPVQSEIIYQAFADAMKRSWQYDSAIFKAAGIAEEKLKQSPHYIRLLQRNYEKTAGDMANMVGTFAKKSQTLFIEEANKAYFSVASGGEGYASAVKDAIDNIMKQGLRVDYPSGHSDTIETATLRAVRTGVAQTMGDITDERMNEYDWDIVLVSQHAGARPDHAEWQGKFYSRTGRTPEYPELRQATGLGTVTGLLGANCRHSYGPGNPPYNPYDHIDRKKSDELYEKQQEQRRQERGIRKVKGELQELQAAIDSANTDALKEKIQKDYDRKAAALLAKNKKYNQYCEETGLKRQQDRLYKAGWTRSDAGKATAAAKRYEKDKE